MRSAVNRGVRTGSPGAGKTSVLEALTALGRATVGDSARAIVAERLARGADRRPDPATFARTILRRDIEQYMALGDTSGWVFFDRGVIDALGMLHEVPTGPGAQRAEHVRHDAWHRGRRLSAGSPRVDVRPLRPALRLTVVTGM